MSGSFQRVCGELINGQARTRPASGRKNRLAVTRRAEPVLPIRPGQPGEVPLGQAFEKQPPVGLGEDPRVQDRDQAPVGLRADEPAHPLAEFDQGVGQRQLVEGVAAPLADALGLRLGDRDGPAGRTAAG